MCNHRFPTKEVNNNEARSLRTTGQGKARPHRRGRCAARPLAQDPGHQRRHAVADVKDALRYVAGYCVINDVSEREFQMKHSGSQWSKGKGCDTFGPIGPWLVTTDELKDPQNLDMWLDVNGQRRQTGNTRTMIFGVADLVADLSKYMTLVPGDVITTGTPPGVGMGMKH